MDQFDTEQQLATDEDAIAARHVEVEILFQNPFDIVNLFLVEQSARRLNLSVSLAISLISTCTWDYLAGHDDFNTSDLLRMSLSQNNYPVISLKASLIIEFLDLVLIDYRNSVYCMNPGVFAHFESAAIMGVFRCTLIFHRPGQKLIKLSDNGLKIGFFVVPGKL
uniref:Uncharacterized protein n=1 Tax=Romanomermis culicivorax TaxID=13658 RepID=A0A915L009_ROMCU